SRLGLSYNITNLFEAKIYSKKDSTTENVKLFQNFNISGSYNFVADSLQWSPVRFSAGTRFFKGITTLRMNATFDPYERIFDSSNSMGRRVNITTLSASQVPFKLTSFTGNLSTNITVAKIRELFQGAEEEVISDVREERRKQREKENELFEETDLLSLFENFSIRHNLSYRVNRFVVGEEGNARDSLPFEIQANSIELRGRIQLTENWQVDIGSIGYDFVSQRVTYPYLSLARDLHCWEMRFNWAPTRGTYSFTIGVKPGTFDFINVPYQRNRLDAEALGGNQF
ncbi:MAG: putative LPS assembly protein LptD, partial [Bacteroidota bacterium]